MNIILDPSYYFILGILLLSIPVFLFSYKSFLKNRGYNYLIILRYFIHFNHLLFLDPTLIIKKEKNEKFFWHLYIDKSLSLNYYKQPSNTALKKGLSNFIDQLKSKDIDFNIFSFGSELRYDIDNIDNLKIDANSTNIGLVFENLNSQYDANIAGGIIFTDGQINQGPLLSKFSDYTKSSNSYCRYRGYYTNVRCRNSISGYSSNKCKR